MTEDIEESVENGTWKNYGRIDASVKMKGYKCFIDEFVGFDRIMPINVIIGRNNSGKSALLDMMQMICRSGRRTSSQDVDDELLSHTLELHQDSNPTFEYIVEINDYDFNVSVKHRSPNRSFVPSTAYLDASAHTLCGQVDRVRFLLVFACVGNREAK